MVDDIILLLKDLLYQIEYMLHQVMIIRYKYFLKENLLDPKWNIIIN